MYPECISFSALILLSPSEAVAQTTTAIISRKVAAQRRKKAAVGVGVAAHAR